MPRPILKKEFDSILEGLALFPRGASLKELNKILTPPFSISALQRRLASLVREGKIEIEGKTRSLRYKLHVLPEMVPKENMSQYQLSFSDAAIELEKKVTLPKTGRSPVGYHREFLDRYRPNITRYLSESTSQKLWELGKTEGERPIGTYAKQIFHRLLIDLSWNSSRLEGNTYSLLETERLLKSNQPVQGKDLKEAQMILNHKDAIEFLVNSAPEIGINRYTILNLHSLLANDLLPEPEACGRLRSIIVEITQSVYLPLTIPPLIAEMFEQILDAARAIVDPFEQSFFLMVHLPYLQPFEDVNKRVSRLAANIPLIQQNLCPLSFVDVPQQAYVNGLLAVYELNRIELLRDVFVWAYERSCQRYSITRKELGDPDPFKIRYRDAITTNVAHIVRKQMNKQSAVACIKQHAISLIPPEDRARFIEIVEKDIMGLHEGT